MIVVDLKNLRDQVVLTPNMEKAVAFLEQSGQDNLAEGRVTVDGENVYVEVQTYDTIEGEISVLEAHRTYIDIQYVVEGEEIIGWASIDEVTETKAYGDDDHDYLLGTAAPDRVTQVRLKAGQLAVLYPVDAHAPRRAAGTSSAVRKLVVKVAI